MDSPGCNRPSGHADDGALFDVGPHCGGVVASFCRLSCTNNRARPRAAPLPGSCQDPRRERNLSKLLKKAWACLTECAPSRIKEQLINGDGPGGGNDKERKCCEFGIRIDRNTSPSARRSSMRLCAERAVSKPARRSPCDQAAANTATALATGRPDDGLHARQFPALRSSIRQYRKQCARLKIRR